MWAISYECSTIAFGPLLSIVLSGDSCGCVMSDLSCFKITLKDTIKAYLKVTSGITESFSDT